MATIVYLLIIYALFETIGSMKQMHQDKRTFGELVLISVLNLASIAAIFWAAITLTKG